MGISLVKGQKISLEKGDGSSLTKIFLGAGWDVAKKGGLFGMFSGGDSIDLDASAIMFDENNKALDSIWFGQLQSRDGSIKHSGDNRTGDGDGDDREDRVQREDGKDDVVECALSGGDLHRFSSPMRETTTLIRKTGTVRTTATAEAEPTSFRLNARL